MKRAYHPALNLKSYERHYLFLKPDILLVADEVSLGEAGAVHSYPSKDMELSGGLEFGWADYVVGKEGEAAVKFTGTAGEYRIAVNYLDNFPGEGTFRVEVDGKPVHEWQTTNRDSDNHYILTPPVQLKSGSKIAFVGKDMPHNCRLIRMAASSRQAAAKRSARWILHTDENAQVSLETMSARACIINGDAALDVYALSPDSKAARVTSENWEILEPDAEVEATKRISLQPVFNGDRVVLIELLRARSAVGPALDGLVATLDDSGEKLKATVTWTLDGKPAALSWDLRGRTVELK